jgi:hypothetical protein
MKIFTPAPRWRSRTNDPVLFMEQSLIEVENLSKSYRRDSLEVPVLRNISLQGLIYTL